MLPGERTPYAGRNSMNTEELVAKYIVAPVIVLLGMFIAFTVIHAFLGTAGFVGFLVAAGGVAAVAAYFGRFWKGG